MWYHWSRVMWERNVLFSFYLNFLTLPNNWTQLLALCVCVCIKFKLYSLHQQLAEFSHSGGGDRELASPSSFDISAIM